MKNFRYLKKIDYSAYFLIKEEEERQNFSLNLIASENYPSKAVLEALGSIFNYKYAEGYPKRRYYAGNSIVDKVEILAQNRALNLFIPRKIRGEFKANVQPYSGSPANLAVYFALLEKNEKVLAMDLKSGGHLTHGAKVNFSGKFWNFYYYGVNKKTEILDYDEILSIAKKVKPRLIVCGATSYPRIIDFEKFKRIAQKVKALLLADISHIAGLIVGKVHPSPISENLSVDVLTSTTHKTLRGPRSAFIISKNEFIERINEAVFPGLQGGPHINEILAKAVCFKEASTRKFRNYAKKIVLNSKTLAQELLNQGIKLVSGGTDNHLILIDLRPFKIKGFFAQKLLEKGGIIVNRNSIPFDKEPSFNPSGLRLGTAPLTTRGMGENEMRKIAKILAQVLKTKKISLKNKKEVEELCKEFPL